MTMAAVRDDGPPPIWHQTAEKVDAVGPGMLTITQVADLTGLASNTIQIALNSEANTGRRARLRHLARPKWNFKGVPLWAVEQVATYHRTVSERWNVRKEFSHLPILEPAEVVKRQLGSLRKLAEISEVPLTTLHRWKLQESFPDPEAVMRIASPTPRVLYSWPALRQCIVEHHQSWLEDHPGLDLFDGRKVTDTEPEVTEPETE